MISGILYHHLAYDVSSIEREEFVRQGLMVALLFVLPNIMRREYTVTRYMMLDGHMPRCFSMWNLAFMCALIAAFLLPRPRTTFPAAPPLYFYVTGLGFDPAGPHGHGQNCQ